LGARKAMRSQAFQKLEAKWENGSKNRVETYLRLSSQIANSWRCVHHIDTLPAPHCGPEFAWSCCSECGGGRLGRPASPGHRFSGDCQLWLFDAQSVMNATSGGRIADCSTSCCGASAWCPCAATSANTASSGSARASAPDPLPWRASFPLPALRAGVAPVQAGPVWIDAHALPRSQSNRRRVQCSRYSLWRCLAR